MKRIIILAGVVLFIVLIITLIENSKPGSLSKKEIVELSKMDDSERVAEKEQKFPKAKEFVRPSSFINTDEFNLADLIGRKVILIDFWTYSCINCQRTIPYLNGWYEKYRDSGLEIVGVHSPEFFFEEKYENVQNAVDEFDIKFPVVMDNEFATWQAYGNHHWPHKYLIDIDGFIVYDHIGEGSYDETEKEIQKELMERKVLLGSDDQIKEDILQIQDNKVTFGQTPEIYFGSARNKLLANGNDGKSGIQSFQLPEEIDQSKLYLEGEWDVTDEYARNQQAGGKIVLKYYAKEVYMVASGSEDITIKVLRDGQPALDNSGADVEKGIGKINDERLYHLISEEEVGEHLLEIEIENPGLNAFTFTFG